ncbi:MAG TPA: hypothetical protein VMH78_00050 [Thermoplasmata archaeon]|nr:hypothetical protein [Thermoplasmata archaeon]
MTSSGVLESSILFAALIAFVVIRRTIGLLRGAPYAPSRLFVFAGVATALYAVFAATTIDLAVATWGPIGLALVAPYAAATLATAWITAPHVDAVARFERRGEGRPYYRLPWLVPVTYLVLFIARFAIEIVLFGGVDTTGFGPSGGVATPLLLVIAAFDLLYGASVGLLFGRAFGIRRAYERFVAGESTGGGGPLSGAA